MPKHGKVHLVIGDPHSCPEHPNTRFEWLGKMIVDLMPDTVVCMGDFANMDSLSSYDRGKRSFEGRRFNLDVEACIDALQKVQAPLKEYNDRRRKNKESQYKPRMVMLGGNHDEDRIARLTNLNPELDGLVSIDMLQYREHSWEYIPYREPINIDGIWYCHSLATGVSGEPISGINMGQKLLAKTMASATVGHSHVLDIAMQSSPDGKRQWGLSAGCFLDYVPDYAKSTAFLWWSGVIVKRNVVAGDYNPEFVEIKEVQRRYG